MNRTILAGCLALVLALTLPLAAFAQEPVETTQATEIPETTEGTLPPETTETTLPPETTPPTEGPAVPTFREIDTAHIYPGMERAYGEGYRPSVENGRVRLVLPLLASGPVYQNQLTASLGLGSGPFVMANYEKAFPLETVTPENGSAPQSLFLIAFDLPLSEDRGNGVYPPSPSPFRAMTAAGTPSAAATPSTLPSPTENPRRLLPPRWRKPQRRNRWSTFPTPPFPRKHPWRERNSP